MGKDQEEEARVFWALLRGRWRPSGKEDAAGMRARTEIKVKGKEMVAEQHQRGNPTEQVTVHSLWQRYKWVALDDVSQWLRQERRNGDIIWFKTTSSRVAGLLCSGQSNRKQQSRVLMFSISFYVQMYLSVCFLL